MPRRRTTRNIRIAIRIAIVSGVALVAVIAFAAGWVTLRVQPVRADLTHATQLLRDLERQLGAGDTDGARATVEELGRQARTIRSTTDSIDWRLASRLPGPGADLAAVRVVAQILDHLSSQAMPAVVELAGTAKIDNLLPRQGRLDLTALESAEPALSQADTAVRRCLELLRTIDIDGLRPEVRAGMVQLRDGLTRLGGIVGAAARASAVLPSMLGAHGPRTILVLFQNPAELRATGGMPGAFIVIQAEDGTLRLVDEGTASSAIRSFPTSVLPLTDEQLGLYTDKMGRYPANVNLTPHFPTAAALAAEMYYRRSGATVDIVVATDPIALSYLLGVTGPVTVPSGPTLTADNAVRVLLSEIYATMDARTQDRYFLDVARAVFDKLTHGVADPSAFLAALSRASGERRLLVWSTHQREQEVLAETVLAGSLPEDDPGTPTIGIYFNDGTGAKLDYYLTGSAQVTPGGCYPDGRRVLKLRLELTSTAPSTGLTRSVTGLALAGDPYTMRTNVLVASPTRGALVSMSLDEVETPFGQGVEQGRAIGVVTVDIAPGQTRVVTIDVLTRVNTEGTALALTPMLQITPGVNPWTIQSEPTQTCTSRN